ncbi:hypothetical protein [Agrobacterium sp. SORGH_AS 787]|uniref:hypothetical protein n=1 Tax=Agrobacterium sp. SORGH_AS 787 TaxID=3041775 RepID=UPI0027837303|nr:hypothetical protein [Rhizobium sp. SORGH_AS_0787]
MYRDLQGYYRQQPEPPQRKPEYRQLSEREQKVLIWVLVFNAVLALVAPIGGATVISAVLALFNG